MSELSEVLKLFDEGMTVVDIAFKLRLEIVELLRELARAGRLPLQGGKEWPDEFLKGESR